MGGCASSLQDVRSSNEDFRASLRATFSNNIHDAYEKEQMLGKGVVSGG